MLGLNIEPARGEGEGLQYLKWINAIGKFAVDGNDNILLDMKGMIVDPTSLKTGWGYITRGAAPEWVWDQTTGVPGAEPPAKGDDYQDKFKRGFYLDVYIPGTGWRPWSSNTKGCNIALENCWAAVHEGLKTNQGMCAKLAFKGSKDVDPMKIPVLELSGWVARPESGSEAAPQTAAPAPAPTPEPVAVSPQPAPQSSEEAWF